MPTSKPQSHRYSGEFRRTFWSLTAILLVVVLLPSSALAADELKFANDTTYPVNPQTLILNNENRSGDTILQFGQAIAETLKWNTTIGRFEFSDDVGVMGDLETTGTMSGRTLQVTGTGASPLIYTDQTTGRVGIGTASPGTAGLAVMNGNVGIGTAAPGEKLEVNGNVKLNAVGVDNILHLSPDSDSAAIVKLGDNEWHLRREAISGDKYNFNIKYNRADKIGDFGIYNQNTNLLVINGSTGNVGIGTSTPETKLEVVGSMSGQLIFAQNGISTSGALVIAPRPGSGTGNTLIVDTKGLVYDATNKKVGIGTAAPSYVLDVQNPTGEMQLKSTTETNYAAYRLNNKSGNMYVGLDSFAGGGLAVGSSAYNGVVNVAGNYGLQFGTNNTVRATIDNAGNVGIGTNAAYPAGRASGGPAARLHVATDATDPPTPKTYTLSGQNVSDGLWVNSYAVTGDGYKRYIDFAGLGSYSSGLGGSVMRFLTNNDTMTAAERMRITRDGNIGIGTTSPETKLEVTGTASGYTFFGQNGLATSGALVIAPRPGSGTGNTLIVDTKGLVYDATNKRVGIGTASPSYSLDVNGNLNIASGNSFLIGGGYYSNLTSISNAGITHGNSAFEIGSQSDLTLQAGYGGLMGDLSLRQAKAGQLVKLGIGEYDNGITLSADLNQSDVLIKRKVTGVYAESGALLQLQKDVTGTSMYNGNYLRWGTTTADLGVIDEGGNVGIGTTAPETKLEVVGTASGDQLHAQKDLSSSGTLAIEGTGSFMGINKQIAVTPETRFITTADSKLTRVKRSTTGFSIINQVNKPAGVGHSLLCVAASKQYAPEDTSHADLDLTNNFTVSLWVKVTSTADYSGYVSRFQQGSTNGWVLGATANGTKFNFVGGGAEIAADATIQTGMWYHVLGMVRDGQRRLYINGSAQAQTSATAFTNPTNGKLTLGRYYFNYDGYYGNATYDDVRVYSRALTDEEVTVMTAGGDPSASGLLLQWKLNESSGTAVSDSSGIGHTATTSGSPTWSTNIPSQNPGPETGSTVEATVLSSQDGVVVAEEGIAKFGWTGGRTDLMGTELRFNIGTNEIMRLSTGSMLGIGTSTPETKLEVVGTMSGTHLHFGDLLTGSGTVKIQNVTDSTTAFQILDADGGNPVLNVDTTNERVGIGTAGPTADLDIVGKAYPLKVQNTSGYGGTTSQFLSNYFAGGNADPIQAISVSDPTDKTSADTAINLIAQSYYTKSLGYGIRQKFTVYNGGWGTASARDAANIAAIYASGEATAPNFDLILSAYDGTATEHEGLRVQGATGNVGIGTTAPETKLEVAGTMSGKSLQVTGTGASPLIKADQTTGRVGIGTKAPVKQLNLYDAIGNGMLIQNLASGVTASDGLFIGFDGDALTNIKIYQMENGYIRFGTNNDEVVRFHASGGFSFGDDYVTTDPGVDNMIIEGNVGIGTAAPETKLEVVGSMSGRSLQITGTGAAPLIKTLGGNVGIGTATPEYVLDVQHATSKVNSKNGYLTNGADYAEYFPNEENILEGSLVGINMETGKARRYRAGDEFIGIASDGKGFVGNGDRGIEDNPHFTLVGLLGQLHVRSEEVVIRGRVVLTHDNQRIGILLENGRVLLR
ncbi:MAG: LamG domain-containing protein [Candidatus Peribacteraceae bacterium]|nr:LamG domain-containing protein [Candidatus Peribacteraceae bacterium]MDD5742994.1 LamG domain-containing protein [Candidatus Peribacteraceae bacterium]